MIVRAFRPLVLLCAFLAVLLAVAASLATGQTPKRGGVLNSVLLEDPPGLMVHESAIPSSRSTAPRP
jgi:hypothetical protein